MELQTLDQQLKVAIQNHQILVAKMKSDPQNGNLQKMLHDLQSRIRTLSERQKQVVQQLRKDLEIKKQQATIGNVNAVNNNNNNNHSSVDVGKGIITNYSQPTSIVHTLPQQVLPLSLTMKQVDPSRFTTILLPAKVTLSPASCVGTLANGETLSSVGGDQKTQLVTLTTTLLPASNAAPTTAAIIYRPQVEAPRLLAPAISPSLPQPLPPAAPATTTMIKVPQYPPPIRPTSSSSTSSASSSPLLTSLSVFSSTSATNTNAHSNSIKHAKVIHRSHMEDNGEKSKSSDPEAHKKKFMSALGLITHDMLTELKSRKSERKRRTTANPQFSYGNWDHHSEKKSSAHYLASTLPSGFKRPRGRPRLGSTTPSGSRPSTPEDQMINGSSNDSMAFMRILHNGLLAKEENVCVICRSKGDLISCNVCKLGYHSSCLQSSPTGCAETQTDSLESSQWTCHNCLLIKKKNNNWPRSLAMVHSYILHKTAKEEEKRQLVQKGLELKKERDKLEQRSKELIEELSSQEKARTDLLLDSKNTMDSIENLKTSVRLLQTS